MYMWLNIDKEKKAPLYTQLYMELKKGIEKGWLKEGEKLPSIRQLTKELNLSRTTVENAYTQLNVEGYILGKSGSGYYVEDIGQATNQVERRKDDPTWIPTGLKANPIDQRTSHRKKQKDMEQNQQVYMDDKLFHIKPWQKAYNKALILYEKEILMPQNHQGVGTLREDLAHYVYQYRGVKCNPDQIIVGAGVQHLLHVLCHVLKETKARSVAFESPGFIEPHHIFDHQDMNIYHIPVSEEGIIVDKLKEADPDLCYVSPSHQFPVGSIMPISKRRELINWAKEKGAYIIEDDYDGELVYNRRPIPALQGLDENQRVIYLGSLSTLFIPTVRMSYMILPKSLLTIYNKLKKYQNPTVAPSEQYALSYYIREGELEKHIRRIKNLLGKKNKQLKDLIKNKLEDQVEMTSGECGTYMILKFKKGIAMEGLIKECGEKGIPLQSISDFALQDKKYGQIAMLRYRDLPSQNLEKVIDEILTLIFKHNT